MNTPKSVIELAKKAGAKMMDIKFVDTFGTWQHFSCPIRELTEEIFSEGLGFDGSSIRGWKSIEASDMLAMPDPATAFIDPFCAVPTLSLTCTIAETGTKEAYTRDPRGIAQRAEKYLISTGMADSAFMGPEAEFFIFDNVQFDSKSNGTFYSIDSEEAIWNTRQRRDAQHRLQDPAQGRLFPGRAGRHAAGHPHRDVPGDGGTGRGDRAAASRSGHRRPGGD